MVDRYMLDIDGDLLELQGLAVPYDTWINWGGRHECIAPNTFALQRDIGWPGNISLVWQHNGEQAYAGTRFHTLDLIDTPAGLFFSATLPATTGALGLVGAVRGGTLACSIEFERTRTSSDGRVERAFLNHVGITWQPAYPTACWLSDEPRGALTPEAQAWRRAYRAAVRYRNYTEGAAA